MYLTGYRIAMIVAGAGSLWIASFLGTEIYNQKVFFLYKLAQAKI